MRSFLRLAVLLAGIVVFVCFADDIGHLIVVSLALGWRAAVRYSLPLFWAFSEHSMVSKLRRVALVAIPALGTLRIWVRFHTKRYRAWWKERSPREKLLLAFIPAVIAACSGMFWGFLLGALAVFSTRIPVLAEYAFDEWSVGVRRAARRAAMRTVEPWFDEAWQGVPGRLRAFVERRYKSLWYRTMFRIARNRRRAVRHARHGGITVIIVVWIYAQMFGRARR